jgi:indole-3-glycerol phosphate synthase
MPSVLDKIAAYKALEIEDAKRRRSLSDLDSLAREAAPVRPFRGALTEAIIGRGAALIAEIKKASPSKGLIREDFDPPILARAYEEGGATCLSVLTDTPSFQGHNSFLALAKAASSLSVLRKDFMFEPYQIIESRVLGADCVLIILAAVDDSAASEMTQTARDWNMDVLVEIHNEEEMERACTLNADLIGINNRNLHTFKTTLETTERLAPMAGADALLVGESGIFSASDIMRLQQCGVNVFLVGESLMRSNDISTAVRNLMAPATSFPQIVTTI